jgi:tungstate transport system ATP-binding protein
MVREARDAGTVIVLVTHDMAQARRLADMTLLLHRGRIVEHAPTSRFFDNPRTAEAKAFAAGDILI